MKILPVAVAGTGNVGNALIDYLLTKADVFERRHQVRLRLVGVCNSTVGIIDSAGLTPRSVADKHHYCRGLTGQRFIQETEAEVLFEAGPTDYNSGEPGLGYIRAALAKGMHVVAVSKGALLVEGARLRQEAKHYRRGLKFRCATASALPAMDLLEYAFANATIQRIDGILTGTTGYILDRMQTQDGLTLPDALAEANACGLCEPDPSFDIGGHDTACKLLIIANAAFNRALRMADIAISGINSVTPADIASWRNAGLVPKLIGSVESQQGQLCANVKLRLLDPRDALAKVPANGKALRIISDEFGETVLTSGASSPGATVEAAIADLAQIVKQYYPM